MKYLVAAWFAMGASNLSRGIYLWWWDERWAMNIFGLIEIATGIWCLAHFLDTLKRFWRKDERD